MKLTDKVLVLKVCPLAGNELVPFALPIYSQNKSLFCKLKKVLEVSKYYIHFHIKKKKKQSEERQ